MKSLIVAFALVGGSVIGIQAIPVDALEGCSDLEPYDDDDDRYLIQRCSDGGYLIDTEESGIVIMTKDTQKEYLLH
jgi:hypothetical protein